jgi:tetratricopeptide (TPR) repeat protein
MSSIGRSNRNVSLRAATRTALVLALATAAACGSTTRSAPPEDAAASVAAASRDERIDAHVTRARELFAAADPGGALVEVDLALELDPQRPDLLLARADGLVVLGKAMAARGENGLFVVSTFEDALVAYDRCVESPRTLLGRAQACARIGRGSDAWAHVLELFATEGATRADSPLGTRAEIVAQAAYLAYGDRILGAAPADAPTPTFAEAERHVIDFVASERGRGDAWEMLANLYLFEHSQSQDPRQLVRALEAIVSGLEHLPQDPQLVARLVPLAFQVGGMEEAVRRTSAIADRLADSASARFLAARTLFDQAVGEFPGPGAEPAAIATGRERFERAGAWFTQSGELDPEGHGGPAAGWCAVANIGRGWVDYYAGELAAAERWFLAANDVFPRGIEWSIEGSVQSGVQGLFAIATAYRERGELAEAARVAALLHGLVPDDANFANNAGFLLRDLAVELEARSRELRASGDATAADDVLAQAWTHMRASAAAYRRAAELLPDDVRVINDAALVFAYYLHEDLDWAEATFRRAIELGAQQRSNTKLTEQQRFDLDNAWGDAHENLAVLLLEFRGDEAGAREWFARAVEIGPLPRPMITDVWLARLDGRVPPGERPYTILDWGRPGE